MARDGETNRKLADLRASLLAHGRRQALTIATGAVLIVSGNAANAAGAGNKSDIVSADPSGPSPVSVTFAPEAKQYIGGKNSAFNSYWDNWGNFSDSGNWHDFKNAPPPSS